jgi:biotin transport system ATP-binding protein
VISFEGAAVSVPLAGGGTREILAPVSLTLSEQRVALIGANGSGKSTMARLINGLVLASTGRVVVDGLDVARDAAAVRRLVAFSFTDPSAQLVMPTCVEDVELSLRRTVPRASRRARALEVLADFGLAAHADDSVHSLSGGQRQLLALAGVLAVSPRILIADEPTTLLDRANARLIASVLLGLSQQLVLVTHDLSLAAQCDRVLVLDRAHVVFDGPAAEGVDHYMALSDAS